MTTRWCPTCDDWTKVSPCPECGSKTVPVNLNPRERGDDDGQEYGDPRDRRDGIE